MTRTQYRAARASIRGNGLYALRWLTPGHAALMLQIVRPASDILEQRAWFARAERKHGSPHPERLAFLLTTTAKRA